MACWLHFYGLVLRQAEHHSGGVVVEQNCLPCCGREAEVKKKDLETR
jgi:hypothetical protein